MVLKHNTENKKTQHIIALEILHPQDALQNVSILSEDGHKQTTKTSTAK